MTRSILCGLLALLSVGALGVLPVACQSGGVGDPCTPEDEYQNVFPGFNIDQENIESRSFQCSTRICLVNHFQGRVSCPQGQPPPKACDPSNNGSDCPGSTCVESQTFAPTCNVCDPTDPTCVPNPCPNALICDPNLSVCTCNTSSNNTIGGVAFVCEPADGCTGSSCPQVLHSYVCHTKNDCQTVADGINAPNDGKDCCIPGTDVPVAVSVCGQCDSASDRDANSAVYCSCRCCAPCCPPMTSDDMAATLGCSNDSSTCGPACDPNFNYCSCPSGYSCSQIRADVGLADKQLAGAYCIKQGTAYQAATSDAKCGTVVGHWDTSCKGTPGTAPTGDGG